MKLKGKLVRWNEDRGFGFIKSESVEKDIFIHISALKRMSRRPITGDVIYFEIVADKDGKDRAENAIIEGVAVGTTVTASKNSTNNIFALTILMFILLLAVGGCIYAYKMFTSASEENITGYSCQGKQYCSEMNSCEEAKYYLRYCPDVKIDGDGDGNPCEDQCGH